MIRNVFSSLVVTLPVLCMLAACQPATEKTVPASAGSLQHPTPLQSSSRLSLNFSTTPHKGELYSPRQGVLCDHYFCADRNGISYALTSRYLGKEVANQLYSEGHFDTKAFTFENGIFCDTREKLCRANRYYDQKGHHSGRVNYNDTKRLFPPFNSVTSPEE